MAFVAPLAASSLLQYEGRHTGRFGAPKQQTAAIVQFDEACRLDGDVQLIFIRRRPPAPHIAPVHAQASGLSTFCTMARQEAEAQGWTVGHYRFSPGALCRLMREDFDRLVGKQVASAT